MTPLAQSIANEMCKPLAKRQIIDPDGIASGIDGFHFFDCTATSGLIADLITRTHDLMGSNHIFLPAEKTWIEADRGFIGDAKLSRIALLLFRDGPEIRVHGAARRLTGELYISPAITWLTTDGSREYHSFRDMVDPVWSEAACSIVTSALALINTPRIIGRRQHLPHAGLQRKMAAAKGMVGKFPLRGWTEIVLEVTPPKTDGEIHETRLSGDRCLHFCRQHLRVRNGRVEMVRDHWRGDPALGIKRSRYRLEQPHVRAA